MLIIWGPQRSVWSAAHIVQVPTTEQRKLEDAFQVLDDAVNPAETERPTPPKRPNTIRSLYSTLAKYGIKSKETLPALWVAPCFQGHLLILHKRPSYGETGRHQKYTPPHCNPDTSCVQNKKHILVQVSRPWPQFPSTYTPSNSRVSTVVTPFVFVASGYI